jgi:hypothetical protein
MELDIRSDGRTVELKSRIQPDDKRTWNVSIVRDRTIVWKGKVERGRLERTFADLPGSEMINVRFSNSSGTVCSASATLPG